MKSILTVLTLMILLCGTVPGVQAAGQGDISLQSIAEIEVIILDDEGKEVVVRKPATEVLPGKTVIYTNTMTNSGDKPATDLHLDNPVPENTVYVDGSATGAGADISFSVDGGETFDKPENLTVLGADGEPRPATAEDYSHIRWVFENDLSAKGSSEVSFRVLVK